MTNRIIFLTFILLFCNMQILNAQEVTAPSGNHFSNNNLQISWTLGEPVTETFSNENNQLTQGFHQSKLTVTAIEEIPGLHLSISAFPNPTTNFLSLKIDNMGEEKLHYTLYDMQGSILSRKQIESEISEIPTYIYAPATYILKISGETKNLKTFKIVKN